MTHIIHRMFTLTRNKEAAGKNNFLVKQKQNQQFVRRNGDEETMNCNRHVITNDTGFRLLTCHHFNTASQFTLNRVQCSRNVWLSIFANVAKKYTSSMELSPLQLKSAVQLVRKFAAFYGTAKFITAFPTAYD